MFAGCGKVCFKMVQHVQNGDGRSGQVWSWTRVGNRWWEDGRLSSLNIQPVTKIINNIYEQV